MTVDDLTDEQLWGAVMRLRGITEPTALDPAVLREAAGLVGAVEVIVNIPGQLCKVSARIPGGIGPLNGWITERDACPLRAMMRAYLKAMSWQSCRIHHADADAKKAR